VTVTVLTPPSDVAGPDVITTVSPSFADRATAGAAYLDKVWPGWHDLIELDRLDLSDCWACILGQLFENYCDAEDNLIMPGRQVPGATDLEMTALGFSLVADADADDSLDVTAIHQDYDWLTACWINLILGRISAR
jgi:hypothetical protein